MAIVIPRKTVGSENEHLYFSFEFHNYLDLFSPRSGLKPGAMIRDGDGKSFDPRGPMIWDNFSIFRTNCAILTSYINARVVVSRVDVVTLRNQILRVARFSCDFSQRWLGIRNQDSSMYFY